MPYESDRQRRYIYAQARKGERWAKNFIADAKREGKTYIKRKRKRQ